MGNTQGKSPYDNVIENLDENRSYFYKFKDGVFLFKSYGESEDEVNFEIQEVISLTKNYDKNSEIYFDEISKTNYILRENKSKDFCELTVNKFDDWVYLAYLRANSFRTGKFMESMIYSFSKKIGAKGIYLIDASRGGKCVSSNLSLSIQLFISSGKYSGKTYYETLGYTPENHNSIVSAKKLAYLIFKNKETTIADYSRSMKDYIKTYRREDRWDRNFIYIFSALITLFSYGNAKLNLIEYFNYLISNDKCEIMSSILESSYRHPDTSPLKDTKLKDLMVTIESLRDVSYGDYSKKIK